MILHYDPPCEPDLSDVLRALECRASAPEDRNCDHCPYAIKRARTCARRNLIGSSGRTCDLRRLASDALDLLHRAEDFLEGDE